MTTIQKLPKIYIEISNLCNLQCSFCPEVERPKKIMSAKDFEQVLSKVQKHTDEITLHLMGEPLAHPEFRQMLKLCQKYHLQVHLTTNGTLLSRYTAEELFNPSLKQINFSLHSFRDNFPQKNFWPYLNDILNFSKLALSERPELYINYRLWNLADSTTANNENQEIIDYVLNFFQVELNQRLNTELIKSKKIIGRTYFHFDTRFIWPSLDQPIRRPENQAFCHALKSHIGIHADGTVVPCCLDKEAVLNLGNIFEADLQTVLESKRAQNIRQGFQQGKAVEELCQKCQFIDRFQVPG